MLSTKNYVEDNVRDTVHSLVVAHEGETGCALFDDNLDAFVIRAISASEAGQSLDLQYYIWNNDLTGNLLGYELLKAADRGVHVRLLLDDMNAHDKDTLLATLEQHENIEIRLFNPSYARNNWFRRSFELIFRGLSLNRRMHNKAWIVDKSIAIVGGRNIGNEYFDAAPKTNFFDVDTMILGQAVSEVSAIFEQFWSSRSSIPLNKLVKTKESSLQSLRQYIKSMDDHIIKETNIYRERLKNSPSIETLLKKGRPIFWTREVHIYSDPPEKAVGKGQDQWLINQLYPVWVGTHINLKLMSPYFVPGTEGVKLMSELRAKNIEVEVLTNSLAATDVMLVHSGYAPYRVPLLKEGVKLYELMPFSPTKKKLFGASGASLHTKVFIKDHLTCFIGSFNFDPRSVRLNTEMGILFNQKEMAKELSALFVSKVKENNSYQLFLENDQLHWKDGSEEPSVTWTHEPTVGIIKRAITKIASWLPIESQL